MLRSCYSTRVQVGSDPRQTVPIVWYWCSPGARDLGFPTCFVSRNYQEKHLYPEIGEVNAATRPWRDGSFPLAMPGQGPPCGPRPVWANGYEGTVPARYPRNDFGLLPCCNTAPGVWPVVSLNPFEFPRRTGPCGVGFGGVGAMPLTLNCGGVGFGGVGDVPS